MSRLVRGRTLAEIAIIASAILVGLLRSMNGPLGEPGVLIALGILLLTVSAAAAQVATGRGRWTSVLALGTLALPLALAGASTVAYPGLGGLSSADIQFLRAIDYVSAGEPFGAPNARLLLYPTSFVALAGMAELAGLNVGTLIQWSWIVSLPIMVGGFGLFVREWTGSRTAGVFGMVVCVSNPWFFIVPIYDGLNLTLLPIWSYVLLRVLKRSGPGAVVCSMLLIGVIVTSHFFTSLFSIFCALGIAAGLWMVHQVRGRGAIVAAQDLGGLASAAAVIPLISVLAWLVYVSERYLREGVGLVLALLLAFDQSGPAAAVIGLSLVSPIQVVLLLAALAVYSVAACALIVYAFRLRSTHAMATLTLALLAIPLVLWAAITPPQFSMGTDLKEWKVRPLFGAFILVAPMVAVGLIAFVRILPSRLSRPILVGAIGVILLNAQTLSLGYGNLGPRTYTAAVPPTTVEDGSLPAGQYRALGDYVRQRLPTGTLLVADWRQSNWITGVGGLERVPIYEVAALANPELLDTLLRRADVAGVAVDRNLLVLKSIFHDRLADADVVNSLDHRALDRVFDSGEQVLYLKP